MRNLILTQDSSGCIYIYLDNFRRTKSKKVLISKEIKCENSGQIMVLDKAIKGKGVVGIELVGFSGIEICSEPVPILYSK